MNAPRYANPITSAEQRMLDVFHAADCARFHVHELSNLQRIFVDGFRNDVRLATELPIMQLTADTK